MSLIADSMADFISVLEDANLPVITDPRNLRPPAVFVDSPSIQSLSVDIVQLTIPVVCVVPPPGNADAMTALIALMDDVLDACTVASTITAEPGLYSISGQDLPAYNIRVTVAYRKDA